MPRSARPTRRPARPSTGDLLRVGYGARHGSILHRDRHTTLASANTAAMTSAPARSGQGGDQLTLSKQPASTIHQSLQRGSEPRARRAERREAEGDARATRSPQPREWSRDIQARQDSIRRAYLNHAGELARGGVDDRRLAKDIRQFVADMPVTLTRRQALAIELRRVLDQRSGRSTTLSAGRPAQSVENLEQARPAPATGVRLDELTSFSHKR